MRTHPGNQWCDDAFYAYVGRTLRQSDAEVTQENIDTFFTELLVRCLPAGNA